MIKTPFTFRIFTLFILLAAVFVSSWQLSTAYGQDNDVAAETETVGAEAEEDVKAAPKDKNILQLIQAGGLAMYPLGFASICGVALIIYNFLAVAPKQFLQPDIVAQVQEAVSSGDVDRAKILCDENRAPVLHIIGAGLHRADPEDYHEQAVKEAMQDVSAEELSGPFVWINYLSVVGTLAPMIGLLGTVSGMVKAFNSIATQGVGKPQLLADNISEALVTTASGLIIGIPAMFFFYFFKNKYGKIASSVSRMTGDTLFLLNRAMRKRGNNA